MTYTIKITAAALMFVATTGLYASGTESYGSAYKSVDRLYEKGKANYYAADSSGNKIKYCVKTDSSVEKVSRKSLKVFKGTSQTELSNSLVHCDVPDSAVASLVSEDQLDSVVYYLNKRYRLRLYGS